MIGEINIEDAVKKGYQFIDVRTKDEFDEFHIPGAFNVPLFSLEEKKEISKIYYENRKLSKLKALQILGPKLYDIVNQIGKIKESEGSVAIYCWRGGMRSLAVAVVCQLSGISVPRLTGGYRAFRNYSLKRISGISRSLNLLTVYGPTCSGKTILLRHLRARYPVIDLEGLAAHRGSAFGGIGLKQPSQKMFDALLWHELENLKGNFAVVEGESRRIGNIFIPEGFWSAMQSSKKVYVEIPLDERLKLALDEYNVEKYPLSEFLDSLRRIENVLGNEGYRHVKNLIETGKIAEAARFLMLNYYDKLYNKARFKYDYTIKAKNVDDLIDKFEALLSHRLNLVKSSKSSS